MQRGDQQQQQDPCGTGDTKADDIRRYASTFPRVAAQWGI
jgi:hypothetical protein